MTRDQGFPGKVDTGYPFGNSPTKEAAIRDAIMTLCRQRGVGKTICPSEAARLVAGKDGYWRALMDDVRTVAADLQNAGEIAVTKKGEPVNVREAKGAIRLGLK